MKKKWKILVLGICLSMLVVYGYSLLPSNDLKVLKNEARFLEYIKSGIITERRYRDVETSWIMPKRSAASVTLNLTPNSGYNTNDINEEIKTSMESNLSWKDKTAVLPPPDFRSYVNVNNGTSLSITVYDDYVFILIE